MVDLIDTGVETMTGGRLQMLEHYLNGRHLHADLRGRLSNVDIDKLVAFHKAHGRAATMTVVNPHTTFGHLQFDEDGPRAGFHREARHGQEPHQRRLLRAGAAGLRHHLGRDRRHGDVGTGPALRKLMEMGELMAYQHPGFWSCCDHLADKRRLEAMWASGERPWATWADRACRQAHRALRRAGQAEVQERRSRHRTRQPPRRMGALPLDLRRPNRP
jgi:glucose-1-phosphate cytidylyltransferase